METTEKDTRKQEKEPVVLKKMKKPKVHIYIPEEMIVQILSKLPVKSIFQFKSVCRLWQSFLSDPNFTISTQRRELPVKSIFQFKSVCRLWQSFLSDPNFTISTQRRERAIFCCSQIKQVEAGGHVVERGKFLYSLDHQLSFEQLHTPVAKTHDHNFLFLGSCNGLVFFCVATPNCPYGQRQLWLWNPATRCRKELPHHLYEDSIHGLLSGLCFDKTSNDYKTVLINRMKGRSVVGVRVDSTRKKSEIRIRWGDDICFPCKHPTNVKTARLGVLANGHLHWIVKRRYRDGYVIVNFDESINKFNRLPTPRPLSKKHEIIFQLGVLDGCLCMLQSECNSVSVLVMKEYGVRKSWTIFNVFELPSSLAPIYAMTLGDEFLFKDLCHTMAYNLKDKSIKDIYLPSSNRYVDDGPVEYVESLEPV